MKTGLHKPSKAEIIVNSRPDHLYAHQADRVKFYQLVSEEGRSTTFRASTRTLFKVVQNVKNGSLESLELIKVVGTTVRQRITLPNFTLERLHGFLELLASMDLANHDARRAIVVDERLSQLDEAARETMIEFLSGSKGSAVVETIMNNGALLERDIINTGYRRAQLEIFDRLLNVEGGLAWYKVEVMKRPKTKDETAWQYFFEHNPWIFGYGLNYRYNTILQREFAASGTDAAGKGQVNGDFLLGDQRFTTFVELKKPDTPLFGTALNRAGAWSLSRDLHDVKSQILEQKAAGTLKINISNELYDTDGNLIIHKAIDPELIVVIGRLDQLPACNDRDRAIQRRTFEFWRRDSRNVRYITYDELYNRARQIVEHSTIEASIAA